MGCQMGVCQRIPDEDPQNHEIFKDSESEPKIKSHLLSLPNEMLVKIMSFLPETSDRVRLPICVKETTKH